MDLALEGRAAERDRSAAVLVAVAVVTLPILQPTGPGRFAPADLMMAAAIAATLVWAGMHRVPVRFPYLVSMGLMIVAGFGASTFSPDLDRSALALVQDAFLLAWGIAVANVIRESRDAAMILSAWAWAATAWSTLLIAATLVDVSLPAATTGADTRATLWFDEPNMAGAYFALSFFVVLLGPHPANRAIRATACGLILWAMLLTGSNGALLSLLIGWGVTAFVIVWRRTDLVVAAANGVILVVLLAGLAFVVTHSGAFDDLRESSSTLVERSLARSPRSAAGRASLFQAELELYRSATPLGRGPASTKENLEEAFGLSKGGHSDYLATLVERGVPGVVGLVLLIGGIAVMTYSVVSRPLRPGFARQLRHPPALIGAFVTLALYAITHETLHYRYVWTLFGILAGLYLFGLERRPIPVVGGSSTDRGTYELV